MSSMRGRKGDRPRSEAFKREATHAGTWYTDNGKELSKELEQWLSATGVNGSSLARAIIAPHAGYHYSGRCAAYAFAQINPKSISRVFLLGPSHHHYTRRCALSRATHYKTPIGDIPLDQEVHSELHNSGEFDVMTEAVDEAEHSMEMHLPYLVKVFRSHPFKLVPILVGALQPDKEALYGKILSKYLDDPTNFFSVSSDFCHWGHRFRYTPHDKTKGQIHKYIEELDQRGMNIIETGDPKNFNDYMMETENTICGRHPIGVLLNMMKSADSPLRLSFVQYEQSSQCRNLNDSSVSYASGVAMLVTSSET